MFLFSTISTNACHGHGWHCIAYMCLRMGCQTTRPLRQLNCSDNSTVQSRTTWLWDNSTDDQHHQDKSQLNDWPPLLTVIVTCLHVFHVNPNPNLPPPFPALCVPSAGAPITSIRWLVLVLTRVVRQLRKPSLSCPNRQAVSTVKLFERSSCLNRWVVPAVEWSAQDELSEHLWMNTGAQFHRKCSAHFVLTERERPFA